MVPSCPYIYAFIHGIILPNSSTFKICTFSPIRTQSTHQQDFCSSANVGKRTCRNCMHSVCYGPEFSQQPCWGLNLFFQPVQWFHKVKLRIEGELLEGAGEDAEGKRKFADRTQICGRTETGGGFWSFDLVALPTALSGNHAGFGNSRKLLINSDFFWLPWVFSSCGLRAQECWLISCGTRA